MTFAPGRVNLIGEHTDYNGGLALPFAIAQGVTVRAEATGGRRIHARALDLAEEDEFAVEDRSPATGWRAFVRGTVAELAASGWPATGARLEIEADLPRGAGLSSSAALEVALCLALLELSRPTASAIDRIQIARLCARVESDWVGARTGLLDQLASLYGQVDAALRIDFRTLQIDPVPLRLGGWRVVVLDSGERHSHAGSLYNQRRAECARAAELLGVDSLRDVRSEDVERLPDPFRARARHVISENARVEEAVRALGAGAIGELADLINASHRSLRDSFDASTPALEAARGLLMAAGAAGARLIGGGFGGFVLGLFAPDVPPPDRAREVRPGPGAHPLGG